MFATPPSVQHTASPGTCGNTGGGTGGGGTGGGGTGGGGTGGGGTGGGAQYVMAGMLPADFVFTGALLLSQLLLLLLLSGRRLRLRLPCEPRASPVLSPLASASRAGAGSLPLNHHHTNACTPCAQATWRRTQSCWRCWRSRAAAAWTPSSASQRAARLTPRAACWSWAPPPLMRRRGRGGQRTAGRPARQHGGEPTVRRARTPRRPAAWAGLPPWLACCLGWQYLPAGLTWLACVLAGALLHGGGGGRCRAGGARPAAAARRRQPERPAQLEAGLCSSGGGGRAGRPCGRTGCQHRAGVPGRRAAAAAAAAAAGGAQARARSASGAHAAPQLPQAAHRQRSSSSSSSSSGGELPGRGKRLHATAGAARPGRSSKAAPLRRRNSAPLPGGGGERVRRRPASAAGAGRPGAQEVGALLPAGAGRLGGAAQRRAALAGRALGGLRRRRRARHVQGAAAA
jgi:hypothetical protein